jgi:hypothetical protein
MASTYSPNLAIELIGTGDQAGSWGATTNNNLGTLLEQAISGYVSQAMVTGTAVTLTIPNGAQTPPLGVARSMFFELTGTGGTNTFLIVPNSTKLYFIYNNTTGAVTVKVAGGTGVSVAVGAKVILVCNGIDIVNATTYQTALTASTGLNLSASNVLKAIPRVTTAVTYTTWDSATTDLLVLTAQTGTITIGVDASGSSAADGQMFTFRIVGGGGGATVTFDTGANYKFRSIGGITLSSIAVASTQTLYVRCMYNSTELRWDVIYSGVS